MRRYPAKLLLFGEHILLLGAPALSVPVPAFGGWWDRRTPPAVPDEQARRLRDFAGSQVLKDLRCIDTGAFLSDLAAGLFFHSNIPQGYGLGSSGALCAAVYDRYVHDKTDDLAALKHLFGQMESFFHGQSSGIDPLTSYCGTALLLEGRDAPRRATLQPWTEPPVVFLIDSHRPRQTAPLVQWFLAQSAQPDFRAHLEQTLLPAHTALLRAWLDADAGAFWPALRTVSQFQWTHLAPMAPDTLRTLWRDLLDAGSGIYLKVCGAGGGGFTLGFARQGADLEALQARYTVIFPFERHEDTQA